MQNLILVEVPKDSTEYFINNIGCLRYMTDNGSVSSCVEPMDIGEYLEKEKHEIIGVGLLGDKKIIVIGLLDKQV